jgi:hypothetical protein
MPVVDQKLRCDFLAIALFDCVSLSGAMPDATSSCERECEGGTNFSANEKAARQRGRPFLSRENSSNGGCLFRQNFLAKSYEPQIRGVKRFLGIKYV